MKSKLHSSFVLLFASLTLRATDIVVPAGGDFQAALNAAQPGDTITLTAGATYTGNFYPPAKPGSSWITIRSSAWLSLPPSGVRVDPSLAPFMARIVPAGGAPAIHLNNGAHHYRFTGIEVMPPPGSYAFDLIVCGDATETTADSLPQFIDFDRVYVHGDPVQGSKRGIALNCRSATVRNSYLSGFVSTFQDTQAVAGWNGPGPFTIENNYLEASGENIMFGGSLATIWGNVPSDITVRQNYLRKLPSWNPLDPSFAGTAYSIKDLFEIKNGQRVLIEGNIFENNWRGPNQNGFGIVFTTRSEFGAMPWAVIQDVTVRKNILRHSGAGFLLSGRDSSAPDSSNGLGARRILIQDNLLDDIFVYATNYGRLFNILDDTSYLNFDHNTVFQSGLIAIFESSPNVPVTSYNNLTNNIVNYGDCNVGCGIVNAGAGNPGGLIQNNAVIGAPAGFMSGFSPATIDSVRFVNAAAHDYRLSSLSPYRNAGTDGRDLGADIVALNQLTASVPAGNPATTGSCNLSLNPPNFTFQATGGTGTIHVYAPANCSWSAAPAPAWMSWTGSTSGSGNGALSFTVAPQSTSAPRRVATLGVGLKKVGVTQQ